MGQKVSPISFRTGVTIGWKSRWFAPKSNYGEFLIEDERIRRFIDARLNHQPPYAAVSEVEIERTREELKVIIKTARPGLVIGPKGSSKNSCVQALTGDKRTVSTTVAALAKGEKELPLEDTTDIIVIDEGGHDVAATLTLTGPLRSSGHLCTQNQNVSVHGAQVVVLAKAADLATLVPGQVSDMESRFSTIVVVPEVTEPAQILEVFAASLLSGSSSIRVTRELVANVLALTIVEQLSGREIAALASEVHSAGPDPSGVYCSCSAANSFSRSLPSAAVDWPASPRKSIA